jgi:putative hemolysin
VPIHLTGPRSNLFHLFDKRSKELRDITLFHEMLNKRGRRFSLIVGKPIDPKALPRLGHGHRGAEALCGARACLQAPKALSDDEITSSPDEAATQALGRKLAACCALATPCA